MTNLGSDRSQFTVTITFRRIPSVLQTSCHGNVLSVDCKVAMPLKGMSVFLPVSVFPGQAVGGLSERDIHFRLFGPRCGLLRRYGAPLSDLPYV